MTATQVFLRFIENEYMNADGTINVKKLTLWREEIRNNHLSTDCARDSRGLALMPYRRVRRSKNFVDDYLRRNRLTLNGFMQHFFSYRQNFIYDGLYGSSCTKTIENLSKAWKCFLEEHINEKDDFTKKWIKSRDFNFTWKE